MAGCSSVTRNAHAKRFVQEVFADLLLAEGFTCPDDKLLCWYRAVNKEIVNSICFYTPWSNLPLMISIGYGIHPLFTLPARIPGVYAPNRPTDPEIFHHQPLVPNPDAGHCNMRVYHSDTQVYAPEGGDGIHTLHGVLLPLMDSVRTIGDCYRIHMQHYLSQTLVPAEARLNAVSITFMDEAVCCNDTDVFPRLTPRLEQLIRFYEAQCTQHPADKALCSTLRHMMSLKQALYDGKREEHLAYLQHLKAANILQLKKKYGINL